MAKPDMSAEPLTLDEVKKRLQLASDKSDHDEDIELLIVAVREEAEQVCGPIIDTTKTFYLDQFPGGDPDLGWWDGIREGCMLASEAREIEVPPGHLQSVTSIKTYDEADNGTTFAASNYFVDADHGRIALRTGCAWPAVTRSANGIEVVCQMGWAEPAEVPRDLKEAMLRRCLQLWAERQDPLDKKQSLNPYHYGQYVRVKFGTRNL